MTINILEMLQNAIGKELGVYAGTLLGESESATDNAIQAAWPALMSGLMHRASSVSGAADLLNMIKGPAVKPDLLLKDLGTLFENQASAEQMSSLGSRLLTMLYGDKTDGLANAIAALTNIRGSSARQLLSMMAPLLFSFLKGQVTTNKLGAPGLMELLSTQAQFLHGRLSDSLTTAVGLGSATDYLESVTAKLASPSPGSGRKGRGTPRGVQPNGRPTGTVPMSKNSGSSSLKRLGSWLALALAAGFTLFYLFSNRERLFQPDGSVVAEATRLPLPTPAATLAPEVVAAAPTTPAVPQPTSRIQTPAENLAPTITAEPTAAPSATPSPTSVPTSTPSATATPDTTTVDTQAPESRPTAARVHFDVGKVVLPKNIDNLLQPIVDYVLAHPQSRITIAGFHDKSGNQAKNKELAKNRAAAVSRRLKGLGVSSQQIELRKPMVSTGTGERAEARRVEVNVE